MMRRSSSITSLSSVTSTPEPAEDTIQIFVKDASGQNTIPLNIPASTTIQTLLTMLSLRTPLPSPIRLLHSTTPLLPTSPSSNTPNTLATYNIPPNATLRIAPLPNPRPNQRKVRCSFKECRDAVQRIIGDCGFCEGKFCGRHRLLEDHRCAGLEDCKKEGRERNGERLERERTVAIRGV